MVQLTLRSAEHCEVEFPCDEALTELTVRAFGGRCVIDIQASRDGLTWASPVVSARLTDARPKRLKLRLPKGTRRLRVFVQNAQGRPTHVEIEDPSDALAATVEQEHGIG